MTLSALVRRQLLRCLVAMVGWPRMAEVSLWGLVSYLAESRKGALHQDYQSFGRAVQADIKPRSGVVEDLETEPEGEGLE